MPMSEKLQNYFDELIESYGVLAKTAERAIEGDSRVAKQLTADIAEGQQNALRLATEIAAAPADVSGASEKILEAAVAAQGKASALAKLAHQECSSAGAEITDAIERLASTNRAAAEAASELSSAWVGEDASTLTIWRNSMDAYRSAAEVWRQGMEAYVSASPVAEPAKNSS